MCKGFSLKTTIILAILFFLLLHALSIIRRVKMCVVADLIAERHEENSRDLDRSTARINVRILLKVLVNCPEGVDLSKPYALYWRSHPRIHYRISIKNSIFIVYTPSLPSTKKGAYTSSASSSPAHNDLSLDGYMTIWMGIVCDVNEYVFVCVHYTQIK